MKNYIRKPTIRFNVNLIDFTRTKSNNGTFESFTKHKSVSIKNCYDLFKIETRFIDIPHFFIQIYHSNLM